MTPNLVTTVQQALGPEVLAGAGERLSEPPAALGRAVGAAVPAVLWSLIGRAREPDGAELLLTAIRQSGAARALADPLGRLQPDAQPDAKLLDEALTERLADFASIERGSSGALLAMVTPLALGAVARMAPTPLNADTLGRTLREQENNIERAFPPGFAMNGVAVTTAAEPEAASPTLAAAAATPKQGGAPVWIWVVLAILIAAIAAFFLLGGGPAQAEAYAAAATGPETASGKAHSQFSTSWVRNSGLDGYSAS